MCGCNGGCCWLAVCVHYTVSSVVGSVGMIVVDII
jgi:hypothetical protein